jgi:hypothetical protein
MGQAAVCILCVLGARTHSIEAENPPGRLKVIEGGKFGSISSAKWDSGIVFGFPWQQVAPSYLWGTRRKDRFHRRLCDLKPDEAITFINRSPARRAKGDLEGAKKTMKKTITKRSAWDMSPRSELAAAARKDYQRSRNVYENKEGCKNMVPSMNQESRSQEPGAKSQSRAFGPKCRIPKRAPTKPECV